MRRGRSRRTIFSVSTTDNDNNDIPIDQANTTNCDNNERKLVRRDNERQRRQQMTFLTASLRSLLPLEMIKGTRSVSDHMHEAVNYITHMKNKIEVLTTKRDELRNLCGSRAQTTEPQSGSAYSDKCCFNSVIVQPCFGGIEIVISSRFALSRVLETLLEEGLDIVGCASTKVNGRLIHTIQSQVDVPSSTSLDLSELQQKLNVILCSTSQ